MRAKVILAVLMLLAAPYGRAQVYRPDANLISNGNFMSRDPQQRPLRWFSGLGLQTALLSNEERHGLAKDDYSLKVSDTSEVSSVLVRSEKKLAIPMAEYQAAAWLKQKSGSPAQFSIEFWDQNNKILKKESAVQAKTTDWQQLRLNTIAPDNCTHVTVLIFTDTASTGVSFFDDVSLQLKQVYQKEIKPASRELFIDDYRIDEMVDLVRMVNPPQKSAILIKPTEPWEGNSVYIYGTVLKNQPIGTGYRMWYSSYLDGTYYLCYATSENGTAWIKPNLGLVEFRGSKNNNITKLGGGTVVYDPDAKDPDRRYKMMTFISTKERYGYNVFFSADGLDWKDLYKKAVLPYGDVCQIAYDRGGKLFIATTKQRMIASNTSITPGKLDRDAFISVSKDFINWSAPNAPNSKWSLGVEGDYADDQLVMSKGGIEANVYGMPVYPYEGGYIGFPWMFDIQTYGNGEFASYGDGKIQPQLAFSRDLRTWSRLVREPIIPLGTAGAWDDGTLYTASNMLVDDKEMAVYYGAMNLPHGGSTKRLTQYARIAKATWRRDGLISLRNGGDDEGTIITKPIIFTGKAINVNVKLNNGGSLIAEVLSKDGDKEKVVLQSVPIVGDNVSSTLKWEDGKELSLFSGQEVVLRFRLKNGDLFSYWFN